MPTKREEPPFVSDKEIREQTDRRVQCAWQEHKGPFHEDDLSVQVEGALRDLREQYEGRLSRLRTEQEGKTKTLVEEILIGFRFIPNEDLRSVLNDLVTQIANKHGITPTDQ